MSAPSLDALDAAAKVTEKAPPVTEPMRHVYLALSRTLVDAERYATLQLRGNRATGGGWSGRVRGGGPGKRDLVWALHWVAEEDQLREYRAERGKIRVMLLLFPGHERRGDSDAVMRRARNRSFEITHAAIAP